MHQNDEHWERSEVEILVNNVEQHEVECFDRVTFVFEVLTNQNRNIFPDLHLLIPIVFPKTKIKMHSKQNLKLK